MPVLYYPFPLSTVTEWPGQRPGSYHVGTDFGVAQGTTLRATADGIISRWVDQYGAYIVDIKTPDGWTVRNGHLSRIDVVNGQRVTIGQNIGLTGGIPGTPGAGWSTGAHLHWELRNAAGWVDPRKLEIYQFGNEPKPSTKRNETDMLMIHKTGTSPTLFAVFAPNFWLEFTGQDVANGFAQQIGANSVLVSAQFWDYCKKAAGK